MAHDEQCAMSAVSAVLAAHKAGQKAVGAITGAIDTTPYRRKEKAVFALSQLPKR